MMCPALMLLYHTSHVTQEFVTHGFNNYHKKFDFLKYLLYLVPDGLLAFLRLGCDILKRRNGTMLEHYFRFVSWGHFLRFCNK